MSERSRLSDIQNLYVYSSSSNANTKIPLVQVSDIQNSMMTNRIVRIDHFREMSIYAFPAPGHLASEITNVALPKIRELEKTMPPGYRLTIGGEYNKQQDGFRNLAVVLAISVAAIYLLVNLAYCYALPFSEIATSSSTLHGSALPVAAKAAQAFLPHFGVGLMAVAGVLSTVGALNGSILTGARRRCR